jgi:hypothetical protein
MQQHLLGVTYLSVCLSPLTYACFNTPAAQKKKDQNLPAGPEKNNENPNMITGLWRNNRNQDCRNIKQKC